MTSAELDPQGKRIEVRLPYARAEVIKVMPGSSYVSASKGGPAWRLPLELTTARRLREEIPDFRAGPRLRRWAKAEVRRERRLQALSRADDAQLERLPRVLPELYQFINTDRPPDFPRRGFQLADIAFMAQANLLNANQPGLGKTIEVIGAVYEAGLEDGPHLVSAPTTSLDVVWRYELERWQPIPVLSGDTPLEREEAIHTAADMAKAGQPFWLVVNPATVRYKNIYGKDGEVVRSQPEYPDIYRIKWNTVTVDEFHKMGLANLDTLGAKGFNNLEAQRFWTLSGTPMGGKPIKLFGVFHRLDPNRFRSQWRWAEQWLDVANNGFGMQVGDLLEERAEEFYAAHAPLMIRRLKSEVMSQLPAKQHINVWCHMTPGQQRQYDTFAAEAEIRIAEERLSATSILAEYARLKQFANAVCTVKRVRRRDGEERLRVIPTARSGKLPYLLDRLEERGIRADDPEGSDVAVVASASKEMVVMITKWLNRRGIPAASLTGSTKPRDRTKLIRAFQDPQPGGLRVLVMTTTAGGVSITLDRADSVHILDETWDPDDQEQLEDRLHRGSRIHQVMCYYYRSTDTIQEYIQQVAAGKAITNHEILDLRRQGFRATGAH